MSINQNIYRPYTENFQPINQPHTFIFQAEEGWAIREFIIPINRIDFTNNSYQANYSDVEIRFEIDLMYQWYLQRFIDSKYQSFSLRTLNHRRVFDHLIGCKYEIDVSQEKIYVTIVASLIDTIVETVIERIHEPPIDIEKPSVCHAPELPTKKAIVRNITFD